MKNSILVAILGFNAGIIATILFVDTGSIAMNNTIAVVVGGLLGGIGYVVGGKIV